MVLFQIFFLLLQFLWSHTLGSSHISVSVTYDFFKCIQNSLFSFFLSSQTGTYIHVRNMGTSVILHKNRLTFKPVMKQGGQPWGQNAFAPYNKYFWLTTIEDVVEDTVYLGRLTGRWQEALSTPGWQTEEEKLLQSKQMRVALWHHKSPPFLLSFLVSWHIMKRKATYTDKLCSYRTAVRSQWNTAPTALAKSLQKVQSPKNN